MRITITLTSEQLYVFDQMMKQDHQVNRSNYVVYLMSQEEKARNKRPAGRPRKDEDAPEDEMPPEHAPKTLTVPAHLYDYLAPIERDKLVNAYDIVMLEARKEMWDGQSVKQ